MSLLTRAKEKAKSTTNKKAKKNTTWSVGEETNEQIAGSLKELSQINADIKALEAKKKIHASVVSAYAESNFINSFCDMGVMPDAPMKIVNQNGDSATYVVQDRSGQYKLKDDQIDVLIQILGEDVVDDLLYTQHTIGFDRSIMAMPGVTEAVDKALTTAVKRMLRDGVLDAQSADDLISVDAKIAFKPGTLDRAASLVGRDKGRLRSFIQAMGSSCCRYVK